MVDAFSCRTDSAKPISDVLVCLSVDPNKDQPCHIEASAESLRFTVSGRGKSTQARVTLQAELFEEFICQSDSVKFVINLRILLDCLHLFGVSSETTAATISYTSEDAILKLSLEESGVITTCDISCLYTDDGEEMLEELSSAFRESPEECQIIVSSEPLRESVQELAESLWAGTVEMEISGERGGFMKLSTGGEIGKSEIYFPRNSEAFISFRCDGYVKNYYPLRSLLLGMRALTVAKETYLRVNEHGILCLQHQIECIKGQETFFDFLMLPEEIG